MSVHDVFISYASEDAAVARDICDALEHCRISCWIAPRDIRPGERYGEAIIDAIETSRIMLFVFSSNSNASPHTVREIERAVRYELVVIPFRIEDVPLSKELEYFLSSPQWLNATGPTPSQQFPLLVSTIFEQLHKLGAVASATQNLVTPDAIQALRNLPARPVAYRLPLRGLIGGIIVLLLVIVGVYLIVVRGGRGARGPEDESGRPDEPVTTGTAPEPPETPADAGERQDFLVTTGTAPEPPETPPSEAVTIANRGLARFRRGDAAGAAEDFTKAIRLTPGSAQLYAFRAQAYDRSERFDESIADWTRFIELNPSSHEGYSARGQQYLRRDDYQRAVSDFKEVIRLDSDSWLGYELMGDASRLMGNHADTIRYYEDALERRPPDPAARYFYMSQAASELGDSAQAQRYMSKAASIDADVAKRLSSL